MAQSSTNSGYKYLAPTKPLTRPNRYDITAVAYSMFTFILSLLLIGLGMRLLFALFVVDNAFARGLTIFTEPFVLPFTSMFHDSHEMLQASTASAFTSYYVFYGITSFISKILGRSKPTTR